MSTQHQSGLQGLLGLECDSERWGWRLRGVKLLLTMDALGHRSFLARPPAHKFFRSANICPKGQENMPLVPSRGLYSFHILVTLFEQVITHRHIT